MKVTLIFAMLGLGFALSVASAASELETLRARCSKQEQQIARLKAENLKLRALAPEEPTAPPPKASPAEPSPLAGKTHKILENETYSSIARKYHVSVESLIAANPEIKPTAMRPGQVIRLCAKDPEPVPQKTSKPETQPETKPETQPETKPETKPETLEPEMPVDPTPGTAKPKSTDTSRPETAPKATDPDSPAKADKDKKTRSITIDSEMTYGEFAAKHGTSTQRLNALNGLDLPKSTVLAKGSELYVPGQP